MKRLLLPLLIACIAYGCNKKQGIGFSTTSAEVRSTNKTQSFNLDKNRKRLLDILIVVDTSTSMRSEHTFLERGLEPLTSVIEGIDWRIAVTTSEPVKCFLDRIITPTSEVNAFGQLIRDAVADSERTTGKEQVGLATIRALRGECLTNFYSGVYDYHHDSRNWYKDKEGKQLFTRCAERKSWLRSNSTLVVLIISDEDNQSITQRIGGSLTDLYFYIESIRKIRSTAHVYGLLNPGDSNEYKGWKDQQGESLFSMVGNLCENCRQDQVNSQYTEVLNDMGRNISAILNKNYTLDNAHDNESSSVVLYYGDGESKELAVNVDYKIDGKTLVLISNLPEDSKKITVSYSYDPDA